MDDTSVLAGFAVLKMNSLAAHPAHVSRRMRKHHTDLRRRDHRSVAQEAVRLR